MQLKIHKPLRSQRLMWFIGTITQRNVFGSRGDWELGMKNNTAIAKVKKLHHIKLV
jgi:hypothetical protein